MPAILFDLDGVLYEGNRVIPGAAETIDWFNRHHIPHLFLTNTSSRPRTALVEKIAAFGIHTEPAQFLTPPLATAQWLKQNACTDVALFIPDATKQEFSGLNIITSENDAVCSVVIGDLGNQWDFDTLNRAFRLLMHNPQASLIALGMTRYWRAEDGLRLDAGPYVSALSYATGRQPLVLGKPARDFYLAALRQLDADAEQTVMIGDDIKGDIQAAQNAGLKTILVRSGKFNPADLDSGIQPDHIIDSIAGLTPLWQQLYGPL